MKRLAVTLMTLWLSACGSFEHKDGPPLGNADAHRPAEVVPRAEPRSKYGNPSFYVVRGRRYDVLPSSAGYKKQGIASWYGRKFHGRRTSSGETYDMYAMTAAHKTLPLPSYARVTHLKNGRSVTVKINDRGPFHDDRLIDLSYAAAQKLGIIGTGTGPVEVEVIQGPQGDEAAPGEMVKVNAQGTNRTESNLYLQLGAFSDQTNVEQLVSRLLDAGVNHLAVSRAESGGVFRVRVGPLDSIERAQELSDELTRRGFTDSHVVVD